jgi:hypothetical protein
MFIGESIGIEFEVEDFPIRNFSFPATRKIQWGVTSDASCESTRRVIQNYGKYIDIWGSGSSNFGKQQKVGGEIRSSIIDFADESVKDNLKSLLEYFKTLGESPFSYRAGIHIHINIQQISLSMLKSLLKTAAILEPVFFAVGGMGYKFRGFQNNSVYCRPITRFGPPVVKVNGGYGQCFILEDVFKSETIEEFLTRWGDTYRQSRDHMFPSRYTWFNPTPLANRGSIEFRIFNKTLDVEKLWSAIVLCSEMVKYSIKHSFTKGYLKDFRMNSIYDVESIQDILDMFREFHTSWDMGWENVEMLEHLIDISDLESYTIEKGFMFSHLMFHASGDRTLRHWDGDSSYSPALIPKNLVKTPVFFDHHNLREYHMNPFHKDCIRA